jgi:inorganic pyrophosphatase
MGARLSIFVSPGKHCGLKRRTHEHRSHPVGDDPPHSVNVVIEVPMGGEPVKYEFDKASNAIFVDRILHTPMRYPDQLRLHPAHAFGRRRSTGRDGDGARALHSGSVVRCRPIAVLLLEDEAGGDEKILAVPTVKTSPYFADVEEGDDLPLIMRQQIEHFFTHYKDLEPEKWVRVGHWLGARTPADRIAKHRARRARSRRLQLDGAKESPRH